MSSELVDLAVHIVRFVDNYQPGIVACEFLDADSRSHTIIEKAPIVTVDVLDVNSEYPRPGAVRCLASRVWTDDRGREVVHISTAEPDYIETVEGLSEFVVLRTQVAAI